MEIGINTKKYSNEDIINLLDPELSVRKNQEMLLEKYDIKVGRDKVNKLLKNIYNKSVYTDSSINNISEKSDTFIIEKENIKIETPKYDYSAFLGGSNFGISF